tara:strand:+ start:125 stop:496 length:372 start_codon:yes stop_codon:yes gene_type:complete
LHQYIRAKVLNKVTKRVRPPIPKKSLRVTSLTTVYGPIPEITIDKDTKDNVTPHFRSARRAAEETIPTTAAGHPRLIARVIFAILSGGPKLITRAIIGRAIMLLINPTHESDQYPNNLSLIIY